MSDKSIELRETMWAEMKPDCYGGETCDQIAPRWYTYAAGDKEGGYEHEPLELAAHTFPPGTKVIVSEPVCPQCNEVRAHKYPPIKAGPTFAAKYDCGFDWDAWTEGKYA